MTKLKIAKLLESNPAGMEVGTIAARLNIPYAFAQDLVDQLLAARIVTPVYGGGSLYYRYVK